MIRRGTDNPATILRNFLARLPEDTATLAESASESGDTVFAHFVEEADAFTTLKALTWGELAFPRFLRKDQAIRTCPRRDPCFIKLKTIPAETRVEHPEVMAIPRPDLKKFYDDSLRLPVSGIRVRESRHKEASRRIARAVCVDGQPTIQYAPKIDRDFSPIGFAFIRAHEYAHFELGHVQCGPGRGTSAPLSVRARELDADCRAAAVIVRQVPNGGTGIVAYAAGMFAKMNWSGRNGYPSLRERSDSLYRDACG